MYGNKGSIFTYSLYSPGFNNSRLYWSPGMRRYRLSKLPGAWQGPVKQTAVSDLSLPSSHIGVYDLPGLSGLAVAWTIPVANRGRNKAAEKSCQVVLQVADLEAIENAVLPLSPRLCKNQPRLLGQFVEMMLEKVPTGASAWVLCYEHGPKKAISCCLDLIYMYHTGMHIYGLQALLARLCLQQWPVIRVADNDDLWNFFHDRKDL